MLAKIVESRPVLVLSGAIVAETLVRFTHPMGWSYVVDTFVVPLEIIDRTETFVLSRTIRLFTLERFVVPCNVFPAGVNEH